MNQPVPGLRISQAGNLAADDQGHPAHCLVTGALNDSVATVANHWSGRSRIVIESRPPTWRRIKSRETNKESNR